MAFVCTAMPQHLRSLLFPLLMGCFEDQRPFKVRAPDTDENDSAAPPFDCLHFSWYNRYTTKVCYTSVGAHTTYSHSGLQGTFAPSDNHPYELRFGNARTNIWQMLPYASKDMAEYGQLFDRLVLAFQEVFMWIENVVSPSFLWRKQLE